MPKFFVCESGPMGGISIVFVANEEFDVDHWLDEQPTERKEGLFVYEQSDRF